MENLLSSVGLILLGAVLGAFMTYVAGYVLEKKKWSAEANLRRRDEIYAPIHDELSLKRSLPQSFELWVKSTSRHIDFQSWERIRQSSLALEIPRNFVEKLDALKDACELYAKARGSFYREVKAAFPDRHEGFDDFGIALRLADKMLVAPLQSNQIAYDYIQSQRSITQDTAIYWTSSQLELARQSISALVSWQSLQKVHTEYLRLVEELHTETAARIERIVKKLYAPSSKL